MTDVTPCAPKTQKEMSLEWDGLAEERHRQLVSHDDISFDYVTAPTLLELLNRSDRRRVFDIGCGTGDFTLQLADISDQVVGVDPAAHCVKVARATCAQKPNVGFVEKTLEECCGLLCNEPATTAVACMTLMTVRDIERFAHSLSRVVQTGGQFIAVFCHPWFWPKYWGYDTEPWFRYSREIFIEAPFSISRCRTTYRTTHIHRPLWQYIEAFRNSGLTVDEILEPMPSMEVQELYPHPWLFPRFIAIRWQKASEEPGR